MGIYWINIQMLKFESCVSGNFLKLFEDRKNLVGGGKISSNHINFLNGKERREMFFKVGNTISSWNFFLVSIC